MFRFYSSIRLEGLRKTKNYSVQAVSCRIFQKGDQQIKKKSLQSKQLQKISHISYKFRFLYLFYIQ
jgi:hypothetical protein